MPAPTAREPGTNGDNWLDAPYSAWAMWHLDDFAVHATITRGQDPIRELPRREPEFDLGAVDVPGGLYEGEATTVGDLVAATDTDAFLVVHDGAIAHEEYSHDGAEDDRHAVLSITKSVVGCIAGILVDGGHLDPARTVASYVEELAGTGYAEATVRDLLDMRSGVRFVEDYTDPDSDINRLDRHLGGGGIRAYVEGLEQERPHGGAFRYRSSETDVLGWVCEKVSGRPMAALISTHIWSRIGAEHDAFITCDATGMAVHDGGLGATARDLARFGLMLLDGGAVPGEEGRRQVVPGRWLRQAWGVDADIRGAYLDSPAELAAPGGWYRNQFWMRPGANGGVLLCLGIHGQLIHVSRRTRTVCVKLSHWPDPTDHRRSQATLRMCDEIGAHLLARGRPLGDSALHGPRGVTAGLRRGTPYSRAHASPSPPSVTTT